MPELQLVFDECKGFSYDLQLVIDKCWQRRSSSATPELSIWKRKPVGARRGALARAHVSVRCVDTFRAVAAFFEFLSPPSSAPHEHMQHTTEADGTRSFLRINTSSSTNSRPPGTTRSTWQTNAWRSRRSLAGLLTKPELYQKVSLTRRC